jgi:hypothetical protein
VTNGAPSAALNDTLKGSISGASGPFTASGNFSGLAVGAGPNSNLTATLNAPNAAGIVSGTATANFKSSNPDMNDLDLGSTPFTLKAQVNNYANPVFNFLSGNVTWSNSGLTYNLDFGNILQNSGTETALLKLLNDVSGPADLVNGLFGLPGGTDFTLIGFNPFLNLAAGDSVNGLSVAFDTSNLGFFTETIFLDTTGHNGSGYSAGLPEIELILRGDVIEGGQQPVPEPSTLLLVAIGLGGVGLLRKKFRS